MDLESGQGVLILVAGPSGSGKDTLLSAARKAFAGDASLVFPLRFVTRADQTGEDHIHVSKRDFERLRDSGLFFLSWEAHGLGYGIPSSVADDLQRGSAVVFNISREIIPAATAKWRRTQIVSVTADVSILRSRLQARGRESDEDIEARVRRASEDCVAIQGPAHVLDNSAPLEETVPAFLTLLRTLACVSAPESVPA
jgi:phosphonate metabolism protein PhnN/1,5-bisphosphokinase (PRPP-forming)